MTIRKRLLITLVPSILLMFAVLTLVSFRRSSDTVLRQIALQVATAAGSVAGDFDALAEATKSAVEGMANVLATTDTLERRSLKRLLEAALDANPQIFGSTITLIPGRTPLGRYAPYYYRSGGKVLFRELAIPSRDDERAEWFSAPVRKGRGIWTEPYFDTGGGEILMVTYSTPVRRAGRIIGVVTADLSLDSLVKRVQGFSVLETSGYAFIVSRHGRYVAHPHKDLLSAETVRDHVQTVSDPALGKLSALLVEEGEDSIGIRDPFTGRNSWLVTRNLKSTGWVMAIMYPRDEILRPLFGLWTSIGIVIALTLSAVIVIILWVASASLAPVTNLVRQTERYAAGDFAGRLDVRRGALEIRKLSEAFNRMGEALDEKIQELHDTRLEIIHRLARAAEYRDADTGSHIMRMSHYCLLMGRAAGLSGEACALLFHASPMHDIGKIGIPDAILQKPGKLTPEERKVMENHTLFGAEILSGSASPLILTARDLALTHHERWDGSGYPKGLRGEEIPLEGRIAAICDVFDSLTSERPYKKAWTVEEAMAEIEKKSGVDFEPRLVELFRANLSDILKEKERFSDGSSPSHPSCSLP